MAKLGARVHPITSSRSVAAIGSVATMRIGIERRDDSRRHEQRNMDGQRLCLEDEEMQRDRNARHALEDAVQTRGQQQPERQRQQAADADDQRRFRQDVLDDPHAREAECAEGGDFAEPLVHRDGQQHRDEQHGKRDRDRGQHARDLTKVGEAGLLKTSDDFAVGRGPELGTQRRGWPRPCRRRHPST